jgi:sugar phosphate permease
MEKEKKDNFGRFLALFSLGFAYGIIYLLPYMKSVFYDQMITATGFTNEQLGQMMSVYAMSCTISYLPGGWIADKFKPRTLLAVSCLANTALCFIFLFIHTNFIVSLIIWIGCGLAGGFAFWPAMLKGVRFIGTRQEQGRIYGIFEALNGITSMLASLVMVWVSTWFIEMIAGFNGAVIAMGVLGLLSVVLIWFSFKDAITYNEDALEETEKIHIKDFGKVLIMPQVWVPSLLLFCGITMYAGMGYLNPYLTNKMGIGVTLVSFLSSFREYGCRVGGIGGGWIADKLIGSCARWQVIAQILTGGLILLFIVIPSNSPALAIVLMFVFALAVYANRVTTYALLSELRVPTRVAGTALALITLIGYIPDMFVHTMFGNWLDNYGDDGFNRIFTYMGVIGGVGVLFAVVSVIMSNRIRKSAQAAT